MRHVVGFPVGRGWVKKVTGSTLNTDGSVTDVTCDDGNGGNVACGIAPVLYLGRTLPNFEGSATSTLRFLKNFQFFVMVDSKRGYKKLDGNARVRCHIFDLCESNWYQAGRRSRASLGAQTSSSLHQRHHQRRELRETARGLALVLHCRSDGHRRSAPAARRSRLPVAICTRGPSIPDSIRRGRSRAVRAASASGSRTSRRS